MKDTFCSYYTNSEEITSYMIKCLNIRPNDVILEPSAGEGVFVEQISKMNLPVRIDAIDINEDAISILKTKFKGSNNISIKKADTLLDSQLDCYGAFGGYYTKVIGNPPFGAWQDYSRRNLLKERYIGQYVKETYSLFLLRCISLLKLQGKLTFIIPDTYMFLNRHSKLREILLTNTSIKEIILFPSKFFPGVSFGYSNLSIITLEKTKRDEALSNTIRVLKGFQSTSEFQLLFKRNIPEHLNEYHIKQSDVLSNESHRFILSDSNTTHCINNSTQKLGDIADIVTGFYSGDNKQFVRVLNKTVKGAKQYDVVDNHLIYDSSSLDGIDCVSEAYIPYVKSASKTRYTRTEDEWFVRWDAETIRYYHNNKKTRFQNSAFYFKTGVAIPMVKASTIKAFIINNRVFDQSIVGIFPKDPSKLHYILALMNSSVINKYIHIINPTANNSANYIKQIPYIEPDHKTLELITSKVKLIISCSSLCDSDKHNAVHSEIDKLIDCVYKL